MTAFILLGIITFIIGLLFLLNPATLIELSSVFNRIVATDHKTMKYRISVGLIFIALSIFFLFMAYYFHRAGIGL